jgi:stearoyl-CoA desaturase (delta-9 desaturase)
MGPAQVKWQRRAVLAATVIPFAGFITAVVSLWGQGLSTTDAAIALGMYMFTGLGVTVGYHRLLTHRSFTAPHPLRYLFAVAGSMAVEGAVIGWVADHRRHHAFADKEGDPHSPHLDTGEGLVGVLKGLWHAHVGWLFKEEETQRERWAPDLLKDPVMTRIDRSFPALAIASFAFPALIGLIATRSWLGAVSAFLWAGLARIFLLHHVTWSINSICHFYGREAYQARDESRNVWPLALPSFGESWHNNHHAFPWSARLGLRAWQIDVGWYVIRLLKAARVVVSVKVPTKAQIIGKLKPGPVLAADSPKDPAS